jgi:Zn-dependent protease/CBS domain-containing protein
MQIVASMTEKVVKKSATTGQGLALGRVWEIEIVAHWSLLVIFALIVMSLGAGVFPSWHPDWSPGLRWSMAMIAAVLFFMSIAVHELSHALVGRTQGVPVDRITLFIFGGMAHTTKHPSSAKAEFLMAAVGPLVSLVIGITATLLGSWLAFENMTSRAGALSDDATRIMASAGPVATVFLWLGPINILLAIFNMIPGFPLDGGRVLRARLWWSTNDLEKATRYASGVGQLFAWFLIGCGLFMIFGIYIPFLGAGLVPGLWLVLIGWFLLNAARMSYQQVLVQEMLEGVPVRAIMRSRLQTVTPDLSVETTVNDYFMNYDQRAFPVVAPDGDLLGLVCLEDIRSVPRAEWPATTVADVMTPASALDTMTPQEPAMEALQRLSSRDVDQLPVLEGRHLSGMVHRKDIMKWLSLRAA